MPARANDPSVSSDSMKRPQRSESPASRIAGTVASSTLPTNTTVRCSVSATLARPPAARAVPSASAANRARDGASGITAKNSRVDGMLVA
jgi:hypothetical protein